MQCVCVYVRMCVCVYVCMCNGYACTYVCPVMQHSYLSHNLSWTILKRAGLGSNYTVHCLIKLGQSFCRDFTNRFRVYSRWKDKYLVAILLNSKVSTSTQANPLKQGDKIVFRIYHPPFAQTSVHLDSSILTFVGFTQGLVHSFQIPRQRTLHLQKGNNARQYVTYRLPASHGVQVLSLQ